MNEEDESNRPKHILGQATGVDRIEAGQGKHHVAKPRSFDRTLFQPVGEGAMDQGLETGGDQLKYRKETSIFHSGWPADDNRSGWNGPVREVSSGDDTSPGSFHVGRGVSTLLSRGGERLDGDQLDGILLVPADNLEQSKLKRMGTYSGHRSVCSSSR